jgi:hypothetical protein
MISLVSGLGQLGKWGSNVEEQAKISWSSHDVGRLLSGQSHVIHHFQGPQVVRRHEEAKGYWRLVRLGKEAFQA